jgi:sulfoxide reductase heme-binding subunit YedZ
VGADLPHAYFKFHNGFIMTALLERYNNLDRKQKGNMLRYVAHAAAIIPLVVLYYDYYTYNLGVDEINTVLRRTGIWGLVFLLGSLAITPLKTLFGWNILHPIRRPWGLYSFIFITIHFLTLVGWDYGFQIRAVITETGPRPYIIVGFLAYLILLVLTITSYKWAMKRLGKNWSKLHKLVYYAGILAVIHFFWVWSSKNVYTEPVIYGAILGILLLFRYQPIKTKLQKWQRERAKRSKTKHIAPKSA